MAVQNSDGTYAGANGVAYESNYNAEQSLKRAAAENAVTNKILGDFLSVVLKAVIGIPILGALVCIGLVALAGLRGFLLLAQTFSLFGVCLIPLLFVTTLVLIKLKIPMFGNLLVKLLILLLLLKIQCHSKKWTKKKESLLK